MLGRSIAEGEGGGDWNSEERATEEAGDGGHCKCSSAGLLVCGNAIEDLER